MGVRDGVRYSAKFTKISLTTNWCHEQFVTKINQNRFALRSLSLFSGIVRTGYSCNLVVQPSRLFLYSKLCRTLWKRFNKPKRDLHPTISREPCQRKSSSAVWIVNHFVLRWKCTSTLTINVGTLCMRLTRTEYA